MADELIPVFNAKQKRFVDMGDGTLAERLVATRQSTVLDLVLSLDTGGAYADGDVLADTQALASAFRAVGERAFLKHVLVLDEDDQGQPFDLIFFDANVALGTENSAPNISDANARNIIGRLAVPSGNFYDIGGVRVAFVDGGEMLLKAGAATTTLYVAAISRGTGTYTASGIQLKLGLLWD